MSQGNDVGRYHDVGGTGLEVASVVGRGQRALHAGTGYRVGGC